MESNSSRRSFLKGSAALVGGLAAAGPLQMILARNASGQPVRAKFSPDYGPLGVVNDLATGLPLLKLPQGFTYRSMGWWKDPMEGGILTPNVHDGMGVVAKQGHHAVLVRNHEIRNAGSSFGPESITYDSKGAGGTTNLLVDLKTGELKKAWASIAGTDTNCAGGTTPWSSWITCEETLDDTSNSMNKTHGWCWDVPAYDEPDLEPLRGMGRFVHEAIAVDPHTDIVYLTEDRGTSGLYRFSDDNLRSGRRGRRGKARKNSPLSGEGVLEMLKIVGQTADLRGHFENGREWDTEWVLIEDPERAHSPGTTDSLGCFKQGLAQGGATFSRLEGIWYGNKRLYFVSTDGGAEDEGQVFEYDPKREKLKLIFESPSEDVLDNPDNIAVSPRGGIILCEDGDLSGQRMHGLTTDGQIFPFAQNNVQLSGQRNGISGDFRGSEWAGATFSWDGDWLFANLQNPGITFAITGPWSKGSL
jgi:secreted PhoX family phosphatase